MTPPPAPPAAHENSLAEQARMVRALQALLEADRGRPVQLIETHISFVLVADDFAYKFKKALDAGFLDFTTLERRRRDGAEELRLNRRLAPALYLGLAEIRGTPDAPSFGGTGPLIDVAVRMKAFDQRGLWDRLAARGELTAADVDELAAQLVPFHAGAAVAAPASRFGGPVQLGAEMLDNLDALDAPAVAAGEHEALLRLRRWVAASAAALAPRFEARRAAGRVRECHGDLHLGNVARIEGRTTVFDCIEFNEDFRWIDVISEVAFMAMDLHAHGRPDLAHRFINAYLEAGGDYAGAPLLDWYLVERALVRAKVAALRARQGGGDAAPAVRAGIELALGQSQRPPPRLLITHGYSGSGKTTRTQALVEALGAVRVRSDVERKRLFGLPALARTDSAPQAGIYTAKASAATLARLLECARAVLDGGRTAIIDATFLKRHERDAARALAAERGVHFAILDFDADPRVLRERVQARQAAGGDASEAGREVLQAQIESAEPLGADERPFVRRCPEGAVDWRLLLR